MTHHQHRRLELLMKQPLTRWTTPRNGTGTPRVIPDTRKTRKRKPRVDSSFHRMQREQQLARETRGESARAAARRLEKILLP